MSYIVVHEYPSGLFGVVERIDTDTDELAALSYSYATRGGRVWVFREEDASTWKSQLSVVPVQPEGDG